jgi:hypothetical protein
VSPAPTDQRRDRIAKVDDYARFGARQYWIVDPSLRAIEILDLQVDKYARAAAATAGIFGVPGWPDLRLCRKKADQSPARRCAR